MYVARKCSRIAVRPTAEISSQRSSGEKIWQRKNSSLTATSGSDRRMTSWAETPNVPARPVRALSHSSSR